MQAGRCEAPTHGRASSTPLVVIARSWMAGLARRVDSISTGRSRRRSGSPPVIRTRSTPSGVNASTSAAISSKCQQTLSRQPDIVRARACSTGSAGCTGRSPRRAGSAAAARSDRGAAWIAKYDYRLLSFRAHRTRGVNVSEIRRCVDGTGSSVFVDGSRADGRATCAGQPRRTGLRRRRPTPRTRPRIAKLKTEAVCRRRLR